MQAVIKSDKAPQASQAKANPFVDQLLIKKQLLIRIDTNWHASHTK